MPKLSQPDRAFLQSLGIKPERIPSRADERRLRAQAEEAAKTDPTVRLMLDEGVPITAWNYMLLAWMGDPPAELDGEVEAELSEFLFGRESR